MWVSKKRFCEMEKKIAALEEEQLCVKTIIENNIKSDEELIGIVKKLRTDLELIKTFKANRGKLLS